MGSRFPIPISRLRALRGVDSLLALVFFTAILVIIQAVAMRRAPVFDLTRNQRHTLAPQTTGLLDSLGSEVHATALVRQTAPERAGVEQMLDLYARRSRHFRFRIADPDREPDLVARLDAEPGQVVFEAGDSRRVARSLTEESLTGALLQVTRTGSPVVYFSTGHGEKDIDLDAREGYAAARRALEGQGYVVRGLPLLGAARVPEDASAVVVAGPRDDFLPAEIAVLEVYLARGGSLLCMIDPLVTTARLAELLARYSLETLDATILDALVVDAGDRTFDVTVAKVRRYERHPITRGFTFATMYPRARPVHILEERTQEGLDARYLSITDEDAWGEVSAESMASGVASRDGDDIAGPLPLAAVVQTTARSGTSARLVLIGDSDFANNVFYGVLGNADFFLNVIAFLAEDERLIGIRPREAAGDAVYITEREGRFVFALCVVALPILPMVAGAAVLWRRRRL